jgi:hypothetical protein
MKTTCPVCSSENVSETVSSEFMQLTLGPDFEVKSSNFKCSSCEEEGDFGLKNDASFSFAMKSAQKSFVKSTLVDFEAISPLVAIERSLELPFRTLNRWKSGDFSASSLVLLRILKTYPWIIKVADNKFSKGSSIKYLIDAAANCFSEQLKENKIEVDLSTERRQNTFTLKVALQTQGNTPAIAVGRPRVCVGG